MNHALAHPSDQFQPAAERRHDLYSNVHKGIRFEHCRLLTAIGMCDYRNAADVADLVGSVRAHLVLCSSHLTHEDKEIHTALESRKPGVSQHAEEGHDEHLLAFVELEACLQQLEAAGFCHREAAIAALYRRFALFVADDLQHMDVEETVLQKALEDNFSDPELQEIEGRIVADIPPAEMAQFMASIMAGINPAERLAMLSGMRAAKPPEAFAGIMHSLVKPNVKAAEWESLSTMV